jgi:aryl-alcohol dehydrogenase-like predicted oxidoreductase
VTKVILGVWPLAGITSGAVDPQLARDTIRAALDSGIDTVDTAFSYGYEGEAECRLGEALHAHRIAHGPPPRIIGKVGQRWTTDRRRYTDASPAQLTRDAEESLRRLGIPRFDWLLLHAIDPQVDLRRSAEALDALRRRGLADRIGISNANSEELQTFAACVPCSALQCPLNLLQPESLSPLIATANGLGVGSFVYWVLMKGLLTGKITRDHRFAAGDSRPSYAIFQGAARQQAHDVVDGLRQLAQAYNTTVANLAIGWAISQPGVLGALVGAKTPEQIRETADAKPLTAEVLEAIGSIVASTPSDSSSD